MEQPSSDVSGNIGNTWQIYYKVLADNDNPLVNLYIGGQRESAILGRIFPRVLATLANSTYLTEGGVYQTVLVTSGSI
jgi:hypothetical protein